MNDWFDDSLAAALKPQGESLLWQPGLVGLHAAADSLIALAYFTIPLALLHYVRRGRDVPCPRIFLLFAGFIFACGLTHAMDVWNIWQPHYRTTGLLKALTAAMSIASALALVRVVPFMLTLPSRKQLADLNGELDERVRLRTADLTAANARLHREIASREAAENEVRRLNLELERRLAEFQTLFNVLPVGVGIATDAGCREIRFNPAYAEMHGLPHEPRSSFASPPTVVPRIFRALQDGRELAPAEMPMPRAVATNAPVRDFEKTIVRHDGTSVELLAHAVPIRDAAGRPRGCVATFQDITTRKRAEHQRLNFERKLLQTQKFESIGMLAGGIAHDFNNLLTGVLGHASLARSQLAHGPADVDPLLAQVEISAQRAADLCRQLLAYAGQGRFVVRALDLNLSISQAISLLKLSVGKQIALDLQLGDALPPFRGDATQLHQVLMNLVINASEAIGDQPGTITVRTQRATLTAMDLFTLTSGAEIEPGAFVCLEISDTGCGIPPEAMPHLFAPFFTTKFVGRGLGLAAVLGIMQGHRGGVRVDSRVGSGTTFALFFPVSAPPPALFASTTPPALAAAGPTRGTILVVDDEEPVRLAATTALHDAGFTAITAADGEEALAHVRQNPAHFDAVLLDLSMPKLDGEDTLMALRMIAPTLPVIIMSGSNDHNRADHFVERGLADFLPKPFTSAKLIALLGAVIAEAQDTA
jgi:signal transduction histidine kinase/CheY-like chemotaxis protein